MDINVLIVDDTMFMRSLLKTILTKRGYNVVGEEGDGQKALEKYIELYNKPEKVDLVLMDITMPVMDGIEAVKRLKQFDKDAVIVMCSSVSSEQNVFHALQEGAKHFIRKPFEEAKVIETIEFVLNKR